MEKKYSTVQINLTNNLAQVVRQVGTGIPAECLAGKGLEVGDPHVTLRWGLETDDAKAVYDAVARYLPFYIRLGKFGVFPPTPSSDGVGVLYLGVGSSSYLYRIHEALAELPHKPYEFTYTPHITVAYVKPEAAEQLLALCNPLEGADITTNGNDMMVRSVILSDSNRKQTEIFGGQFRTEYVRR